MLLNAELFQKRNIYDIGTGALHLCFLKDTTRKLECFRFYAGPHLGSSLLPLGVSKVMDFQKDSGS